MTRELTLLLMLSLSSYRLTRLIVKDTFPPVLWFRDHLAGGWRDLTTEEQRFLSGEKRSELYKLWNVNPKGTQRYLYRSRFSRYWLAELITCPWCASGWISGALTALTDLTVGLPVPWLFGPAVWGAAALLASQEWS